MERAVFVADLERLPSPGAPCDRLYLGSEFCVWRLPDPRELAAGLAAAADRGAGFSLVTPFLDEPGLTRVLALVRLLPDDPAIEVVANDLGLLEALRSEGWRGTLVAGRLLTRQRRGPGFQTHGEVPVEAARALCGSALDAPGFIELLGSAYGVRRFELDDLVQGVSLPSLPAGVSISLYRPYLLVTATRTCPWVFDDGSRDHRHGCARPCRGQALRLAAVQEAGGCGSGVQSTGGLRAGINPAPTPEVVLTGEGMNPAPARSLLLGGCAQFLEYHNEAPPPAGVDRIVWQPELPA